jgi:mannose-6-phosphate isomerase-like protein (cupin superfamily)
MRVGSMPGIGALVLLLAAAPLALGSADSDGVVWKHSALAGMESKLAHELDDEQSASEVLGTYGNHHVEIAHREATGGAELHETQNDVFFIVSGEATLVLGGSLVDPKTTEPHEIEGKSIVGGARTSLAAGDVVHIPFNVPHQMILAKGKQITYFVVKIDASSAPAR